VIYSSDLFTYNAKYFQTLIIWREMAIICQQFA